MKKLLVIGLLFSLLLSACGSVVPTMEPVDLQVVVPTTEFVVTSVPVPDVQVVEPESPCEKVMSTEQFFLDYAGKPAVFQGVYENGAVYAFSINNVLVCVLSLGSVSRVGELVFYQELVKINGESRTDFEYIFSEHDNNFIGFSGIVGNSETLKDMLGSLILYNQEPVVINSTPPDSCEMLSEGSAIQFSGKEVKIVFYEGGSHSNDSWDNIAFLYEGTNYCLDSVYLQKYEFSVVDITGRQVLVETSKIWQILNRDVIFYINPGEFTDNMTEEVIVKSKIVLKSPISVEETEFGDPMVYELMSRPTIYDELFWNQFRGRYLLFNSSLPETVNPGYLISPLEYVSGGEIEVGSVLGVIDGNPVVVTDTTCGFGGFNGVGVLSIDYSWTDPSTGLEVSTYSIPYLGSYIFITEGDGQGQVITYFFVPVGDCELKMNLIG